MRQLARCSVLALALAGASQVAQAQALEFHGYTRSSISVSSDGGKGACFGIGSINPFRLGNECDTVIEPTFTARFANLEDKSAWGVTFMPSIYARQGGAEDSGVAVADLHTHFGQIYLFGENVPQLANGRVWAGRRFYQRLQTGINDEFLENLDGDGAGIEEMNLGFGKLSVAWQANVYANAYDADGNLTDNFNTLSGNRLSARLTDIKTFPEGSLSFYTNYNKDLNRDDESGPVTVSAPDTNGTFHIAAYHNLNGVLGGSNLLGLGYTSTEHGNETFDFTVQQSGFISGPQIGWDAIFRYRNTKADNGDKTNEYAIGGRLDGHIAGPFRWLTELSYNNVDPEGGDTQNLTKFTAALAMSAGPNPWSRPTFRLYYSYFNWNDAAGTPFRWSSESSSHGADPTKNSSGTFGIQGEAWW
ncbi:carbohydrate porin [Niveibacterium sp. SC-1]|uniref:carbohydrate porin n=1 Tax=Niveibacterium sp. SC-1 TaxID=3135646 RepID=UPI00311F4272